MRPALVRCCDQCRLARKPPAPLSRRLHRTVRVGRQLANGLDLLVGGSRLPCAPGGGQETTDDGEGLWGVPSSDNRFNRWRYRLQDKLDPLRRVQEIIGDTDADKDVYTKESLRAAKTQAAIDRYHKEHVEPLLKEIADSGLDLALIEEIAYAMHAPEANARLRRVNARRYIKSLIGARKGEARESLQAALDAYDETATAEDWGRERKQQELLDLLERSWGETKGKEEADLKKRWDSIKDKLSGMNDADAAWTMRRHKKNAKAVELAKKMQALTDLKVELLVEAGGNELLELWILEHREHHRRAPRRHATIDIDGVGEMTNIISGGINISPVELESAIRTLDGVEEVAVIAPRPTRRISRPCIFLSQTRTASQSARPACCPMDMSAAWRCCLLGAGRESAVRCCASSFASPVKMAPAESILIEVRFVLAGASTPISPVPAL